jgi:hypothetical protein
MSHNLSGQNLMRHLILEEHLSKFNIVLISDSAKISQIFKALFSRCSIACHVLELYSISFAALKSEYSFEFSRNKLRPIRLLRNCIGFIRSSLKLALLLLLARNGSLIIVSSEERKEYLRQLNDNFRIVVIKNKPVYKFARVDLNKLLSEDGREDIILIGSLNNRNDFEKIYKFAKERHCKINCYGLSEDDKCWIDKRFEGVIKVINGVSHSKIPELLMSSKYAICFYRSDTINQKYSASSKIYEILYFGCVPIVSSNFGLVYELSRMKASYINVDEIFEADESWMASIDNSSLIGSEKCIFKSEVKNLEAI